MSFWNKNEHYPLVTSNDKYQIEETKFGEMINI